MPLYEYRCASCDHTFEELVRAGESPDCPRCHGRALTKLFSTFAVGAASFSSVKAAEACPPQGCGMCAQPGGCGMDN